MHVCLFPFDDLHPHLIHLSLYGPYSPSQTAPRSNQPFFHNSPTGSTDRPTETDRPTDGIGDKSVANPLTLYCIDRERTDNSLISQLRVSRCKVASSVSYEFSEGCHGFVCATFDANEEMRTAGFTQEDTPVVLICMSGALCCPMSDCWVRLLDSAAV